MMRHLILNFVILLLSMPSMAQTLAECFSDGMIVAKDQPVYVFGKGNSNLTVCLAGKTARAKKSGDGWIAKLPSMHAGGPYVLTVTAKDKVIVIKDVYVGTVIMAAGQSNMQFKLKESNSPESVRVNDPLLRSFSMDRIENKDPYKMKDGWIKCTKDNAGNWSAIGYLVARQIRDTTGEAVGVINCYQGASVIETWMPKDIAELPEFALPDEEKHPDHFKMPYGTWNHNGQLFDFAVRKIAPYGISNVVWYQGESNTGKGEASIYPKMAAAMVNSWREVFKNPDMPFVMIQIADFIPRNDDEWKNLQKSQMDIPKYVKSVDVVRSSDICESNNIHPASKDKLSKRVADTILGKNME